ncbi:hypothetical protein [Variovorax gossypii]
MQASSQLAREIPYEGDCLSWCTRRTEDVLAELHGMLSRWLFNHLRHADGACVPAVKAHLQVTESTAERIVKAQARKELAQGGTGDQIKQGWLKRVSPRVSQYPVDRSLALSMNAPSADCPAAGRH